MNMQVTILAGGLATRLGDLTKDRPKSMVYIWGMADQWGLLTFVYHTPGMSQSDLARMSHKDKTGVTRMLDLLERRGYLTREDDESDRRAHRLRVTPAGEQVIKRVAPLAAEVNRASCVGLDDHQIEALREMLYRIRDNIANTMQR